MAVAVAVAVVVSCAYAFIRFYVRGSAVVLRLCSASPTARAVYVLDVRDDLLEQLGDVVVVELVDDAAAVAARR